MIAVLLVTNDNIFYQKAKLTTADNNNNINSRWVRNDVYSRMIH